MLSTSQSLLSTHLTHTSAHPVHSPFVRSAASIHRSTDLYVSPTYSSLSYYICVLVLQLAFAQEAIEAVQECHNPELCDTHQVEAEVNDGLDSLPEEDDSEVRNY